MAIKSPWFIFCILFTLKIGSKIEQLPKDRFLFAPWDIMLVVSFEIRHSRIGVVIWVGVIVITFLASGWFIGSLDEFIEFTSVEPYAAAIWAEVNLNPLAFINR